jgi:thiamine transport system ATP-binding protein
MFRSFEMATPFLVMNQVCARQPGTSLDAIRNVDLSLEKCEVVSILGSSGAGKTSLLRVIAGLIPTHAGKIILDGEDITKRPVHRRGVGMMFQDHALFPHLSVIDNVAFGLKMSGVPRSQRRERANDLLELVGLPGFGSRQVASLSGGEKQRVALARTLAPSPQLLLLDEPLGSLDRVLRDSLLPELAALISDLRLTVLFVTHDRSEAMAISDRVAVMEKGELLQIGTAEQLQHSPISEYVSRLLGHG